MVAVSTLGPSFAKSFEAHGTTILHRKLIVFAAWKPLHTSSDGVHDAMYLVTFRTIY